MGTSLTWMIAVSWTAEVVAIVTTLAHVGAKWVRHWPRRRLAPHRPSTEQYRASPPYRPPERPRWISRWSVERGAVPTRLASYPNGRWRKPRRSRDYRYKTVYVTVSLDVFPAASVALTVNLPFLAFFDVSIGCPFATVPVQLTTPDRESPHENSARTT